MREYDAAEAPVPRINLPRRLAAEAVGTAGLLVSVVGSGIMGEQLAGGNVAIALLANSLATGFALFVLISVFGDISGAHLNPVVTFADYFVHRRSAGESGLYVGAQIGGGFAGVAVSNVMFGLPGVFVSERVRSGTGLWVSEVLATFGLLLVIQVLARRQPAIVAVAVGAYIAGAYWFTSSTSFANPAVTLARMATNTFTGIRPVDAPAFIVAQFVGALIAIAFASWMDPVRREPEKSPAGR
jgi:glycerol uptake facilitator-like aquaporin